MSPRPSFRPRLRALAARLGITEGYTSVAGQRRLTSDRTREALVASLGWDGSTEVAAARALGALEREAVEGLVSPVQVMTLGRPPTVALRRGRRGRGAGLRYRIELHPEDGAPLVREGRLSPGASRIPAPAPPEPGYYRATVAVRGPDGERIGTQRLVVVPRRCPAPEARTGGRGFGVLANLWTVRSETNWGVGDLTDLAALARWAGDSGAAFVGLNPLHALRDRTGDLSPYSPISRLFRDPLYLDLGAVPGLARCAEARDLMASPAFREDLERVRRAERLDRRRVMALKWPVLEALHRAFDGADPAYRAFVAQGGDVLTDFATHQALDEQFASQAADWRSWPPEYRRPDGRAVDEFRRRRADRVDFHRYAQFELDRQLGAAARAAGGGLAIGLSGDLAIGSSPGGFDSWAFPGLFVEGVYLGAPPDEYSAAGQDWGLPPVNPARLAADRYQFWTLLLRQALEHMGALRIDHSMGLLRQYWIPAGRPAEEGAYVRFPAADLLGILTLESRRRNAIIVAEDLGTVPRGFGALLRRWGLLSTRVLYFEQDARGRFWSSARYSRHALVLATTHDHPTVLGFWEGRDLELRHQVGALAGPRDLEVLRARRDRDRRALLRRLRLEGFAPAGRAPTPDELITGVHRFLARTPAPLVGVSLDDLAAEREPLNLPGISPDRFPSWTRRMRAPREALARDPLARSVMAGLRQGIERPRRRPPGRK